MRGNKPAGYGSVTRRRQLPAVPTAAATAGRGRFAAPQGRCCVPSERSKRRSRPQVCGCVHLSFCTSSGKALLQNSVRIQNSFRIHHFCPMGPLQTPEPFGLAALAVTTLKPEFEKLVSEDGYESVAVGGPGAHQPPPQA